jgi:hypothetical protein
MVPLMLELILGIGAVALLVQRIVHNRKVRKILEQAKR